MCHTGFGQMFSTYIIDGNICISAEKRIFAQAKKRIETIREVSPFSITKMLNVVPNLGKKVMK
jgi:hypothetical protein